MNAATTTLPKGYSIISADMMIALINLIIAGVTVTPTENVGGSFTLTKGEDDARLFLRHDGTFGYAYPGIGTSQGATWWNLSSVMVHFGA